MTMSSTAAEAIRAKILSGAFPPGFQLRQDFLARELGMSRIPIREALLSLEADGIVSILPHKGAIVVERSIDDIQEVFDLRMLIEPQLLLKSAPRLQTQDVRALRETLKEYTGYVRNMDISKWNDLNTKFHMQIYQYAQSPRTIDLARTLMEDCERYTRIHLLDNERARIEAVGEHAELLRLCEERYFETAAALMREHISRIAGHLTSLARASVLKATAPVR